MSVNVMNGLHEKGQSRVRRGLSEQNSRGFKDISRTELQNSRTF